MGVATQRGYPRYKDERFVGFRQKQFFDTSAQPSGVALRAFLETSTHASIGSGLAPYINRKSLSRTDGWDGTDPGRELNANNGLIQ